MDKNKKVAEARTELIGVRYTLEQRKQLEAQADPIPLSTYIRNLSLHRARPKSVPLVNLQTYQELQKISLSLTQIRHALPNVAQQSEAIASDQLQEWFALLQDLKLEIKQIGLHILGANIEEGVDEDAGTSEFTL
jgi:hypothetical protein